MGSYGFQTRWWRRVSSFHDFIGKADIARSTMFIVTVMKILSVMCFFALVGCATSLRFGSPPKVDQLTTLTPGVSTVEDVRRALGEPRGYGMARLNVYPLPATIWFYEYEEAAGSRMNLKFLIVFVRQDLYDGHLWFASANLIEQKP